MKPVQQTRKQRQQQVRQRQARNRALAFGAVVLGVLGIASYLLITAFYKPGLPPMAGNVVDVAVGVVAGNAAPEPDDLADAQVVGKYLLELRAGRAGIALLDVAEQALFRGEEGSAAVDINAAAFQYDRSRFAFDLQNRSPDFSVYYAPDRA